MPTVLAQISKAITDFMNTYGVRPAYIIIGRTTHLRLQFHDDEAIQPPDMKLLFGFPLVLDPNQDDYVSPAPFPEHMGRILHTQRTGLKVDLPAPSPS